MLLKGIIKVNYSTNYQAKYKLAIEKDGQKQYFDLAANTAQSFPFNLRQRKLHYKNNAKHIRE